ncbi:MAG: BlaI family transcriptional regulator, penicillinase repressor [Acidobacteriota bacterium]|jgi:predicted transcriptional regulator|nr:BlaI family transcriptional regulator, penicillinase repressor [Acidobacteriota bacterium]
MAKESDVRLTKFELEVMRALWALGSASVREVQERLPEEKRPAYTTVQTIVYRLEEKGALRRVKKVGNAHVFEPVVTPRATARRLFNELLGFFGGSPRTLMAQLVEAGHLTLEDLREAEETLGRLEAEKRDAQKTTSKSAGERKSKPSGKTSNESAGSSSRDETSRRGAGRERGRR